MVLCEDGAIVRIGSSAEVDLPAEARITDLPDGILIPAYFDVHFHGSGGYDVMQANREALDNLGTFLARRGVAGYLATTVTASEDTTLKALNGLAGLMREDSSSAVGGARAVGIHLEGPFLSHEKRGVHPPKYLLPPTLKMFDRLWEAAEGQVRLITIAPELPGAEEVIARAVDLGVRVSLGHTNATADEARKGIAAGASSATHTFNAMRQFSQRDPGILGVVLTEDSLYAELICDGHHVDPVTVKLFWKAKGLERAMLVTDAISATGMPDGKYMLGTLEVDVRDGKCLLEGAIAGSTLTLDRAVGNFHRFTGVSVAEAAALAGRNPARMVGLDKEFGLLATGRRADFAVLNPDGSLRAAVLGGRQVS